MNVLRPDEEVVQSENERARKRDSHLKSGLKTAASIGATALGSPILSKIAPFLSEYIPAEMAIKGINKVAPGIGKALDLGAKFGLPIEEGFQYLKDKLVNQQQQQQEKEQPKQNKNIIEQYSPELFQFLKEEIGKGRQPVEAAAIAQHDKRFAEAIKKLQKDHKAPWSSIIESIFGTGQTAQPQQQQAQQQQPNAIGQEGLQPPGSLPTQNASAEANAFQGLQGQQQEGQGESRILDAIQRYGKRQGMNATQ